MENGTRNGGMFATQATIQNNSLDRARRENRVTHADCLQAAVANVLSEENAEALATKLALLEAVVRDWQHDLFVQARMKLLAGKPAGAVFSRDELEQAFKEGLL